MQIYMEYGMKSCFCEEDKIYKQNFNSLIFEKFARYLLKLNIFYLLSLE